MIEINRKDSPFIFRISPDNPVIIERRLNQHGARWGFFKTCDSKTEAKISLLRIERGDAVEGDT
ncbi:MAG: hypothetical protein IT328_05935 [Caldilineaceae bacterium]|nr:hypothetical protein [Caldilineaceae bacterium]